MRKLKITTVLCLSACFLCFFDASNQVLADELGGKAADIDWRWNIFDAGPLASRSIEQGAVKEREHYEVDLFQAHDTSKLQIKIMLDGKQVYTWEGSDHSVLRIRGNDLYYIEFNPNSSGGSVVAVDLSSGKEIWRTVLIGLGTPRQGADYSNQFNLDVVGGMVIIFGNESAGKYIEVKNMDNGETIGHKVVEENVNK